MLRLPEDDADALKHVAVLTMYKILLIYMLCIIGLDNKLYKMHGTYVKILGIHRSVHHNTILIK